MRDAEILAVGRELERKIFVWSTAGERRELPFAYADPAAGQPVVEHVAKARGIAVDEATIIAGGVRGAAALGMDFAKFHEWVKGPVGNMVRQRLEVRTGTPPASQSPRTCWVIYE